MKAATRRRIRQIVGIVGIVVVAVAVIAIKIHMAAEREADMICRSNLSKIDGAMEQYALEFNLSKGAPVTIENLLPPGRGKPAPKCPAGGVYSTNVIGEPPTCSLGDSHARRLPHVLLPYKDESLEVRQYGENVRARREEHRRQWAEAHPGWIDKQGASMTESVAARLWRLLWMRLPPRD